jgi:hypothetical protein
MLQAVYTLLEELTALEKEKAPLNVGVTAAEEERKVEDFS